MEGSGNGAQAPETLGVGVGDGVAVDDGVAVADGVAVDGGVAVDDGKLLPLPLQEYKPAATIEIETKVNEAFTPPILNKRGTSRILVRS